MKLEIKQLAVVLWLMCSAVLFAHEKADAEKVARQYVKHYRNAEGEQLADMMHPDMHNMLKKFWLEQAQIKDEELTDEDRDHLLDLTGMASMEDLAEMKPRAFFIMIMKGMGRVEGGMDVTQIKSEILECHVEQYDDDFHVRLELKSDYKDNTTRSSSYFIMGDSDGKLLIRSMSKTVLPDGENQEDDSRENQKVE